MLAAILAAAAFTVQPVGLADGQTVSGTVHVEAAATADLQRIEISVDGRIRSTDAAYDWDTTSEANGPHVLQLWAVARDGTVAGSRITLVVQNSFQVFVGGVADGQQVTGTIHLSPTITCSSTASCAGRSRSRRTPWTGTRRSRRRARTR